MRSKINSALRPGPFSPGEYRLSLRNVIIALIKRKKSGKIDFLMSIDAKDGSSGSGSVLEREPSDQETNELVVVGSSAGGVEALSILVSNLPADFPAPIVLAQHLDPTRPSNLAIILQRRTILRVVQVDGKTALEPGHIYVVPSNRNIVVRDGDVEVLSDNGESNRRVRPSVDLLFSSAAKVYADRLIAVVLTGSGSDGTAGAIEVSNAGGIVIVQNPQTARYPSMPMALPPSVVDFEIDLERIGPMLYSLLSGVVIPQDEEETAEILRSILEQVSHRSSIDFRQYKTSTILRRITRRMTVTLSRTMSDYRLYLETHPDEIGELVQAFLINVTQFFRDPEAFVYLKNEVLPVLIQQARERDRVLRFWSAGCSTGEEPYSMAMLLADLLGAELPEWSAKIFATDLDEAAISFARRGFYSEAHLKGVPREYQERFFEHIDGGYRISKTLRQMVIFGQQDLGRSAPFPRVDLVMCRNVLIYFTPELQDYVINRFGFSLSPEGFLFLGKAETVRPSQTYFDLRSKNWKVYRCNGNSVPVSRRQPPLDLGTRSLRQERNQARNTKSGNPQAANGEVETGLMGSELALPQLRRFNELLLRFLPVGVVVVDRSYHLLTANSAARRLLGLREMGNELDFLHSVRGIPYAEVRKAIDAVFRERTTVTLAEIELNSNAGGNGRYLTLSLALMQIEAGSPDLAAISIFDVSEGVTIRRQLESVRAEQSQLMTDLGVANRRLNDMNKELVDANEELQVANEELVLTHEELQATIEEFETTNEELQATNEELETNNEELQATNEELQTTNEELRARTSELQELNEIMDGERVRLAEIIELAPFSIVVLRGSNLLIEALNLPYLALLQERQVQGRTLEEVFELFGQNTVPLVLLAQEVFQQDQPRSLLIPPTSLPHEIAAQLQDNLNFRLVPTHGANDIVNGVIIYAATEETDPDLPSE